MLEGDDVIPFFDQAFAASKTTAASSQSPVDPVIAALLILWYVMVLIQTIMGYGTAYRKTKASGDNGVSLFGWMIVYCSLASLVPGLGVYLWSKSKHDGNGDSSASDNGVDKDARTPANNRSKSAGVSASGASDQVSSEEQYKEAVRAYNLSATAWDYAQARRSFEKLGYYKSSREYARTCAKMERKLSRSSNDGGTLALLFLVPAVLAVIGIVLLMANT